VTGDWLDRAALAAGRPVTRGRLIKLAAAAGLSAGPFGSLLREAPAQAAPSDTGDCVDCVLTTDAEKADNRRYCATRIARAFAIGPSLPGGGAITAGLAAGCLGIEFGNWLNGYNHCRPACEPQQPRTGSSGPTSSSAWAPPRQKAPPPPPPPPEPKKPTKKKPGKKGTKPGGNPPPPKPKPEPLCKSCPACCPCSDGSGLCCCNCCHPSGTGCGSICG
jgi:hypothetical protein